MNRAKKAIKDLHDYLGRDKSGITLLDSVSVIVNKMRKEIAAQAELIESLRSRLKPAEDENHRQSVEVRQLKMALRRERSITAQYRKNLANAATKISQLEAELEPKDFDGEIVDFVPKKRTFLDAPPDDAAFMLDTKQMNGLFKSLRRRMNRAPQFTKKLGQIRLCDIVTEYSRDQYLTLGMFATVCALTNMPVTIFATRNFITEGAGMEDDDFRADKFIHWVRDWIDTSGPNHVVRPDQQTRDSIVINKSGGRF